MVLDTIDWIIIFGLERMFNVQVGPDHFERKKSFKPENYFKHSIGITANNEAEPVEVKLKCNEVLTKYLESQPLHIRSIYSAGINSPVS